MKVKISLPFVLLAISSFSVLISVLKYCSFGLDFSDEGFYIVSISNPRLYDYTISQFGFIYNPLLSLLNGNIVSLRQVNVFITSILSTILSFTVISSFSNLQLTSTKRLLLSFSVSITSLFAFDHWLITPSYNSLAFQSLLILSTGFLISDNINSRESYLGNFLIGFAGWLLFMAKPSSALVMAIFAPLYLVMSKKFSFRLILISILVSTFLLITSALVIDGSIVSFVSRYMRGLQFASYLGGGHTAQKIFRIDKFSLNQYEKIAFISFFILTFTLARLSVIDPKKLFANRILQFSLIVSMIFVVLIIFNFITFPVMFNYFKGLIYIAVILSTFLLSASIFKKRFFKLMTRVHWGNFFLLIVLPYAFTFGTGRNYWQNECLVGFFWVMAGFIFLVPVVSEYGFRPLLPYIFGTQLITAILLQSYLQVPYRQESLLTGNKIKVAFGNSSLILSEGAAKYIQDSVSLSKKANLEPHTPVIDLSGQSPALLYALRAHNIGQAWTIGGYPGSNKLAVEALKRVDCKTLSASWVLSEPNGPRSISDDVLMSYGANTSHYSKVAEWITSPGAGGYKEKRLQLLYKPNYEQVILESCLKSRLSKLGGAEQEKVI